MPTKRRWSQAAIDGYRAANGGAYPPGQEPEAEDYSAKTADDRARVTYALAHGTASGADSAAAKVYGVLQEEKPEKPQTAAQRYTEARANAEMKFAYSPEKTTHADSVLAGYRPEKVKPEKSEALADKVLRYVKRKGEIKEQLNRKGREAVGAAAGDALLRMDQEYSDSLDYANIAQRAGREWLPLYEKERKAYGDSLAAQRLKERSGGLSLDQVRAVLKMME